MSMPQGLRSDIVALLQQHGYEVVWSETRERDPFEWHMDAKKEGYEVHVEEVPTPS